MTQKPPFRPSAAARPTLLALCAALVVAFAGPQAAVANSHRSTLEIAKQDAAAGVAEAAAHAVLHAALQAQGAGWGGFVHDRQAQRADPSLFVGPYDAWVVAGAHPSLDAALDQAEALAEAGVETEVMRTYDGDYEITIGADRFARARRALQSWRRVGVAGPGSRLSSGAHYVELVWAADAFADEK